MKRKVLSLLTVICCILTSCTPSNYDDIGIDIVISQTETEQTKADYTMAMGEPEGTIFPHSFLTPYDDDAEQTS